MELRDGMVWMGCEEWDKHDGHTPNIGALGRACWDGAIDPVLDSAGVLEVANVAVVPWANAETVGGTVIALVAALGGVPVC